MNSPVREDSINWPRLFAEYVPPATHLAAAIQYPMTDRSWPERVVTAYMRDWRKNRRAPHTEDR